MDDGQGARHMQMPICLALTGTCHTETGRRVDVRRTEYLHFNRTRSVEAGRPMLGPGLLVGGRLVGISFASSRSGSKAGGVLLAASGSRSWNPGGGEEWSGSAAIPGRLRRMLGDFHVRQSDSQSPTATASALEVV